MMDGVRKLEILAAQERFRRRSALAGKLAEGGVYLIGPLSTDPLDHESEPSDADPSAAQSSADMITAVHVGPPRSGDERPASVSTPTRD